MAARAPVESIVELIQDLVRLPSRAGIDPYEAVFSHLEVWLTSHGVHLERVPDPGGAGTVAMAGMLPGSGPGPTYVLNATVDTAPFGDPAAWSAPPTSGAIEDGWLLGRGSADCKAGVAIFCHLLAAAGEGRWRAGNLAAVFDADEHTGGFAGIRASFDDPRWRGAAGVLIGYPGNDEIVVGSRGFLRATVRVSGTAAHTGARRPAEANALARAARLVTRLDGVVPDDGGDPDFPLAPKVTVTSLHGGEGFSVVPDTCDVGFDVRLTPRFDAARAEARLRAAAADLDVECPVTQATTITLQRGWPAYRLPATSPLPGALREGALRAFGRTPPPAVVGPSNAGNYLAGLGIEATAGFGVTGRNVHAVDEAIDLASIGPAYEAYGVALDRLLGGGVSPPEWTLLRDPS